MTAPQRKKPSSAAGGRDARPLVVSVVGARPQFIKLAPLISQLDSGFRSKIVHSGQHYDFGLSGIFFGRNRLRAPDAHLEVGSASNAVMTSRVSERFDEFLSRQKRKADAVLVFGDTNTTLGAALAAHARDIPVGHIEAGLRSFVPAMAEERNRVLTDRLSAWLFCPTETAVANLRNEKVPGRIFGVGDVMYEQFLTWRKSPPRVTHPQVVSRYGLGERQFYLMTCHRAETTDKRENLTELFHLIAALDGSVIFPVHPRTEKAFRKAGMWTKLRRFRHVTLLPPLSHDDLLALAEESRMILTDSGGLQKEAYWLGVPCLTLRDKTEWVELVDCGANSLIGLSVGKLLKALRRRRSVKPVRDRYFKRRTVSQSIVRHLSRALKV